MTGRPQGACALVTGGGRGIGAACAHALADDGWSVAVLYRGGREAAEATAAAITQAGGTALAVNADITDAAACDLAFTQIENELGPVLCLVNNAGVRADNLALSIDDAGAACVSYRSTGQGAIQGQGGRAIAVDERLVDPVALLPRAVRRWYGYGV